ncbi:MAG: NADH-quinone oxidoreductase subunit L [Verrucomicrobia bacterium]|nr:NADH-quinone oxidoreductase subunit L [Verrucomicrobiota bacterium]
MRGVVAYLWLIPLLPLLAAGAIAVLRQPQRALAARLAIGSLGGSLGVSLIAFFSTLGAAGPGEAERVYLNFPWFELGGATVRLGWVLDPLAAAMAVMVSLVSLLIFIYSVGYMAHDENFTRFFGFLALFAAAMLGLVIANSLLLLFICWELVGLASYLLIGFWYHKPSAAAAAKKAFITTRVGDLGFLLGLVWLYAETGTLLCYDGGNGCLEQSALAGLVTQTTVAGLGVSTAIGLLIFCGAVGKSGQVPLHVWLPDAMEGPTPVSALIHAATMVAAGVFLVARVYPLMDADAANLPGLSTALAVVAWVGVVTAVFAACIAVAQTDIKRILAYSTVSQLGFMMLGLGVGGVAVGMFHLLTHACFKALLFLGAGSVIHGVHDEQDIRRMGGLRRPMPITFATYAVGMMALAGVPVFFSGFWSKDEILHAAHGWTVSQAPFYLGLLGALLTAFYMTRQVCYVFFGPNRGGQAAATGVHAAADAPRATDSTATNHGRSPHESPPVMTWPLLVLAGLAVAVGFVGTPAWPWLPAYLEGQGATFAWGKLFAWGTLGTMLLSTVVAGVGIGVGWWLYGRRPIERAADPDALERWRPEVFGLLRAKFHVDEFYEATFIRWHGRWAAGCAWVDRWVWGGMVLGVGLVAQGLAWLSRWFDEYVVNLGFDAACERLTQGGGWTARLQDGQTQNYLKVLGVALAVLLLLLTWGGSS